MSSSSAKQQGTSHLLSLAKAFSWRIVATLTTALIAL